MTVPTETAPTEAVETTPAAEPTPTPETQSGNPKRDGLRAAMGATKDRFGTKTAEAPKPEEQVASGEEPATPESPEATATGDEGVEGQPAETPAGDGEQDPPKEGTPEGILIELPEDHPIRQSLPDGSIRAADEVSERAIRGLVNMTGVRRKELEAAEGKTREVQTELRTALNRLARIEAEQVATQKWKSTPEYQRTMDIYERIKEEDGEEEARKYLAGALRNSRDRMTEEEYRQRQEAMETQEAQRAEEVFVADSWSRSERLPAEIRFLPELRSSFESAVASLGARIEAGDLKEVLTIEDSRQRAEAFHAEVWRDVIHRLQRIPHAVEAFQRAQAQQKPRPAAPAQKPPQPPQKTAEELKREMAENRLNNPTHPLSRSPSLPSGGDGGRAAIEPEQEMHTSPLAVKRNARATALALGASRFGN